MRRVTRHWCSGVEAGLRAKRRNPPLAAILMMLFVVGVSVSPVRSAHASHAAGGDTVWLTRFVRLDGGVNEPSSIAASPDGTLVFVTGSTWKDSQKQADYATVAYDTASGDEVWEARYDGPTHREDDALSVVVSPDGSKVFVSGRSGGQASDDFATVAYDSATGDELWIARFASPSDGWNDPSASAISPDGTTVFVTGTWQASDIVNIDYLTVAFDSATGLLVWSRRYDDPRHLTDYANAIAASPDGSNVIVTGTSDGAEFDYLTLAYDAATGATAWHTRSGGSGSDQPWSVAPNPDGSSVFVTGDFAESDVATIAYDEQTGVPRWRRSLGTDNRSHGNVVSVSPDGSRVFVAGWKDRNQGFVDYFVAAYEPYTGARLWRAGFEVPEDSVSGFDYMAVSPDGSKVFVTGQALETVWGLATVSYEAGTGAQVWNAFFNGTGISNDIPAGIAVSPDGSKVFVTSLSNGPNGLGYGTVAYEA
jgi:DNA-binding beta-propeller fold protein YncE